MAGTHGRTPAHRRYSCTSPSTASAYILLQLQIAKLHYPMPLPRQLPPAARLLRILLNRLILPPSQQEPDRPKPAFSSPGYAERPPTRHNLVPAHHLFRHRLHHRMIQPRMIRPRIIRPRIIRPRIIRPRMIHPSEFLHNNSSERPESASALVKNGRPFFRQFHEPQAGRRERRFSAASAGKRYPHFSSRGTGQVFSQ